MKDTTSAVNILYELEKQHRNYHHADVVRGVLAEIESGNWEFLCQLAQSIIYDWQIARKDMELRARALNEAGR